MAVNVQHGVVMALVEAAMLDIDGPERRSVCDFHLIGSDSDHRPVLLVQRTCCPGLCPPHSLVLEPCRGYRCPPWATDVGKWMPDAKAVGSVQDIAAQKGQTYCLDEHGGVDLTEQCNMSGGD